MVYRHFLQNSQSGNLFTRQNKISPYHDVLPVDVLRC